MVTLVFIHGWVERPTIWDDISRSLSVYDQIRMDLGFFDTDGDQSGRPDEIPENSILIGHSLGYAYGMEKYQDQLIGAVSINGFQRFTKSDDGCPGVAPRILSRMQKMFMRDPIAVAQDFLNRCGMDHANLSRMNPRQSALGLQWLAELDVGGAAYDRRNIRQLALASEDDVIVTEEMSRSSFPETVLHMTPNGGHMLPQSRAGWCASKIKEFLKAYD